MSTEESLKMTAGVENCNASSASVTTTTTTTTTSIVLSPRAFVKMLMHAMRYPYATVNGVLIAEKKGSGAKGKSTSIKFVDCVPLFHSGHGLTPMVEIALTQVSKARMINLNYQLIII